MNSEVSPAEQLKQLMSLPEEDISLAEAGLVIALDEYPGLDVAACLHRFEDMAATLLKRLPNDASTTRRIMMLNRFLFAEQGFTGNSANYYDPRNSFINEVLERKTGIPITLAIVYMEIGARLGLPFQGVSFPGHFLVKCPVAGGQMVIDPFAGGASLSDDEIRKRLAQFSGGEHPPQEALAAALAAAGKKEILARLLRNLKVIYLKANDLAKALSVIERILIVTPEAPQEVRDRGLVYQNLECFRAALADLQRYLELVPAAQDGDEIRTRVGGLKDIIARLN